MNKITLKISILIIILFLMALMSSCWDNRDLTKRTFIAGLGIDKIDGNRLKLTLQLIKSYSTSEGENHNSDPIVNNVSNGETLHEAIRNQFNYINRKPFYSHIQTIIIGEALAKEGIKDVLDFFERDHETKLTPSILIAKGTTANEILNIDSKINKILTFDIKEICESSNVNLSILNTTLLEVLKNFSSVGRSATISTIEIIDDLNNPDIKGINVEGGTVFKNDKLIGWLSPTETAGLKYIINETGSGIINIKNPIHGKKQVAIEQTRAKGKMDALLENGKLTLIVQVNSEGIIGNQEGIGDLSNQGIIKEIEYRAEAVIKQQIEDVLKLTQSKYKSDIFGFANVVHKKYLTYWKENKYEWENIFSKAYVEIRVNFKVNNPGIINKAVEVK